MDVRCEKCQTEYELDESRLKPGGVTVKCTNCGHMFKIRKRTNTNVGLPVAADRPGRVTASKPPPPTSDRSQRADSVLGVTDHGSGPNAAERHWLIRLENGEQKTCRELATLQQWIVAGVATRDSLISRSGKTWKRLGDITELAQYFTIADEAKAQRSAKPTKPPTKEELARATMLGVGAKPSSAGGSIIPDEDDGRATGNFRARTPTPPPPPPSRTPPSTAPSNVPKANPMAQTELSSPQMPVHKRAPTQPPPMPSGNRAAGWASGEVKASESMASMPQGPQGGRLSAMPDEPGFAGRVRVSPTDEHGFTTAKVKSIDDEDDLVPGRERGSRAGLWIAVLAVIVIGAAAGVVYMMVFKKKGEPAATGPADAAQLAVARPDAAPMITPIADAPVAVPVISPLDDARASISANVETGMRSALALLDNKDEPAALVVRARITTALAQALQDRAGLVDKTAGDKLRKDGKQLVIDAAVLAQKALKARPDDVAANLAMADVLRLQGKSAREVKRYIDQGRAKAAGDKGLGREVDVADAMVAAREGKLDDAQKTLMAADTDPADVRAKVELALIAFAQAKPAVAKALIDQVIAMQPDHAGAKALQAKLETSVVRTDPLPPEEGSGARGGAGTTHTPVKPPDNGGGGGNDYDSLLARGNKIAETNCTKAMDLFQKALELKPNGVEALTAMGYCHIEAKQFASAFSKFRAALVVSPRYEPALGGVAEAYQQQGRKEQAIESWRAYLEIYPSSAKAKKQLEILGASAEPAVGSETAPVSPPAPGPAPTTSPGPTPTPAAAPSAGSGSG